jgi:hypothetical protein
LLLAEKKDVILSKYAEDTMNLLAMSEYLDGMLHYFQQVGAVCTELIPVAIVLVKCK